ncbi:MAG: SDR family oxidoreductase [Rhodobacteraceae bacterium]|nr:SDR family oxidoreductase [Paracoccaceae bacterium]MCY4251635.1 SDR family oxidoreductase [Paracoccaceae bacterium]
MGWVDRFSLAGKVALVTGASSGIGAEISRVFTEADAKVIATGQSIERLNKLKEEIGCEIFTANIASSEGCEQLISKVNTSNRQIDILVNSAGVALVGPVLDYSVEDWDRTMAINLRAPFLLAKGLAPGMIAAKAGKIINISSQTGVIALEDHVAYATSKGGLNALTKSLMVEFAPHNIQVNAICPTVVMTEMGRKVWSSLEKSAPMIAATPLGRFGEPVEVADMALYLASPASDLVNGSIMMIEGGYSSV